MSALTEALERITKWLESHQPEYAESFLPGLSRGEIDDALNELELRIPEEFYELYQWRNGRRIEPFNENIVCPSIYELLSLNEVKEGATGINSSTHSYPSTGNFLLPFLGHTDPELCVLELNKNSPEKEVPVLIIFEGEEANFFSPSITSMFLFFAEAYEEEAYYLSSDEDGEEWVFEDEDKIQDIAGKYGISIYKTPDSF